MQRVLSRSTCKCHGCGLLESFGPRHNSGQRRAMILWPNLRAMPNMELQKYVPNPKRRPTLQTFFDTGVPITNLQPPTFLEQLLELAGKSLFLDLSFTRLWFHINHTDWITDQTHCISSKKVGSSFLGNCIEFLASSGQWHHLPSKLLQSFLRRFHHPKMPTRSSQRFCRVLRTMAWENRP